MSRRSSRFIDLAIFGVVSGLVLVAMPADAQSCCAGGGAYAPARLKIYETAAVGLQVRASNGFGSFDSAGRYFASAPGNLELGFEESIVGAWRVNEAFQIGAAVPFEETWRRAGRLSGGGGGLGDISINGRYELLQSGGERNLPGLAVSATVTTPTGRPPEQARTPLAVDATGSGYWQGVLGVSLEELFGRWLLAGTLTVAGVVPRRVGDTTEVLGPQVTGLIAGGYGFRNGSAIVGTIGCRAVTGAWVNGTSIPDAPVLTTAGVAAGWPINFEWRLQGALSADLPILGRSREVAVAFSATVLRTF